MTRLASLGSGSRGNGTLVDIGGEHILVDCGFSLKQAEARLHKLDVRPAALSAIIVTHEHSDHAGGVAALAYKYAVPVYATYGTLKAAEARTGSLLGKVIDAHAPWHIGAVTVTPVVVPHDAREPTQFVISHGSDRVGVISDLGHVTPFVTQMYQNLDLLLMESNHDRQMLLRGRYPERVKRRIAGDLGHLSNAQAADFLDRVAHPALRVVIGHVSEENNHQDLLDETFAPFLDRVDQLDYANQPGGVGWVEAMKSDSVMSENSVGESGGIFALTGPAG